MTTNARLARQLDDLQRARRLMRVSERVTNSATRWASRATSTNARHYPTLADYFVDLKRCGDTYASRAALGRRLRTAAADLLVFGSAA